MLQGFIVALVVAAAAVYSAWTLMPATWRRALARRLLHRRGLARLGALRAAAEGPGGCGSCGSCAGTQPPPAGPQPLRWQRRPPG